MPHHILPVIQPRVLVVDDSPVERTLYVHLVGKWGYSVQVASNAEEALELIEQEAYELILADWQMPGMNGSELCATLRAKSFAHYVYIILMSSQREEDFLISALQAGADDVLIKPVDTNELEARLQSATRRLALQSKINQQTEQLAQAHATMAEDLRRVSAVQRSYLPDPHCKLASVDYLWTSVPSQYVSGDHLNVFALNEHCVGFYILDVSGHGIPAAVKSMQLVQMFLDQSPSGLVFVGEREPASPAQVVGRLNRLFQQTDTDLSYFTLIYGIIDTRTQQLRFCQAGHPTPLLIKPDGQVQAVGQGGYPVGLFDQVEFEETSLQLQPGEHLLLYSDGLTEVLSPSGQSWGEQRLIRLLEQHHKLPWGERLQKLVGTVQQWGGKAVQLHGFDDDLSLLVLGPTVKGQPLNAQVDLLPANSPITYRIDTQDPSIQAPSRPPAKDKASIVIVDDSRSFVRIFQAMLTTWGFEVYPAQSAQEALQLIETHLPNFVLTDWDMPGMSGIELCEYVRAQDFPSYIYIMMITGFASREDLLRSLRVGADDFLTKPLKPSELKVRLQTAVRVSALHSTLYDKHNEFTRVYGSLQRDMREVARIQRSLLPKSQNSPWPVAVQTLYQPRQYVCGLQMGSLQTAHNELGFLMIAVRGHGTSAALQAMALSRWFSIAKATEILFPPDGASLRIRRYLAEPHRVVEQLTHIVPAGTADAMDFDLLYGLLNLDQGTLLVAGIGAWQLTLVPPNQQVQCFALEPTDNSSAAAHLLAAPLYQDVILPGTQVFAAPWRTAQTLQLTETAQWMTQVVQAAAGAEQAATLPLLQSMERIQSRLPTQDSEAAHDMALFALQWRQAQSIQPRLHTPALKAELMQALQVWAAPGGDTLRASEETLHLGAWVDVLGFQAVADTATIGQMATRTRQWLEQLGYVDETVYAVELVLSEALTNILHHGFYKAPPLPVLLDVVACEEVVAVRLQDQGQAIPPNVLQQIRSNMDYLSGADLGELPEGGMGLTFIRMTAQRFNYQPGQPWNCLGLLIENPVPRQSAEAPTLS